jgi:hypothetical protein
MSLATASMTENAPTARAWPPSAAPLKPLSLNMPWQQGLPTADKLALTSSLGALQLPQQLAPAAPALAQWGQPWGQQCAQLGEQWGQPFGQPFGQPWGQQWHQQTQQNAAQTFGQAYGAWPAAAPAVDMLVLPSGESSAAQGVNTQQDVVKVSYTSAEDLAEALFPTGSAATGNVHEVLERHGDDIEDLTSHRELVHEALLDHRDQVQGLHKTVQQMRSGIKLADSGLMDHKLHIQNLKASNASMLRQIDAHAKQLAEVKTEIKSLHAGNKSMDLGLKAHATEIKSLHAGNKSMDLGLKAHAKAFELQNQSISALSTKQSAVSKDVASLSQTLRSVAPQDDDRQQQIRQLQKNMLETQAQLARLQPLATATTVNVNAPRIKRKL